MSRYDHIFARPSVSYKVFPWLSAQFDMDLVQKHDGFQMRFMPSMSVSKRISDFSLSLRQQFYYIWYPGSGATAHLFTTKGSVTYSIPDTPLALSFAMEPLYRATLIRNRIFAGLNIRLNDHLTLCPQYLRKAYHNRSGKRPDRNTQKRYFHADIIPQTAKPASRSTPLARSGSGADAKPSRFCTCRRA